MQMVYNSEAFAVVEIEVPASVSATPMAPADASIASASAAEPSADEPGRAAFEIVDKMARTDIFLTGDIARQFREGVEALSRNDSTPDQIDEFISRYTGLPRQPLILH